MMAEHPLHVVAVTGCVRDSSGRLLLVRVAARGWEMPGGQVEEGEDLVAALRREIEEETGCQIRVESLVGIYSRLSPPTMVLHLFECSYLSGEAASQEAEVPEVGWYEPEAARKLVTHQPSAQRLADALSRAEQIYYRVYRLRPYEAVAAHAFNTP
jgi:8-oxo-dGTP diphosphatase